MASFGLMLRQGWLGKDVSFDTIREIVSRYEITKFDSVWFADHFFVKSHPSNSHFEAWITLAAVAAITNRLRLGTAVTCNSYRHPALLAKMSSTLDVISNGRLDLGIGAGWHREEYLSCGMPFPSFDVRVEQLREAVQLMTKMWTEEKANFSGKYYTIHGALNQPKPVQKPHPPIWIGGKSDKILRVVAELADGCNFLHTSTEEFSHLQDKLDIYCDEIKRNPGEIHRCWQGEAFTDTDPERLQSFVKRTKESSSIPEMRQMPVTDYLARRIVGTPQECIERVDSLIDVGTTHFILYFLDFPGFNGLRTFSNEVIPCFSKT